MKKKIALITGITGQEGAYLTEFLLNKNYIVHGIKRRSSSINTQRIDKFYKDIQTKNSNFILHHGDMMDTPSIYNIISKISCFLSIYVYIKTIYILFIFPVV